MKIRLSTGEIRIRISKEEINGLETGALKFTHPILLVNVVMGSSLDCSLKNQNLNISLSQSDLPKLHDGLAQKLSLNGEEISIILEEDWKRRKP